MKQYSRQLIEDLSKHLNSKLVVFFEMKHSVLEFPVHTILDLVEYALNEYFKGANKQEDLVTIVNNARRARLARRTRWFNSLQNDVSILNYNDPRYPFSNIVSLVQSLSIDTYTKLYGNKTIERIIEEEIEKAKMWRNDSNFLLIEFPALNTHSAKTIFQSLTADIISDLWEYIKIELNGSLSSYLITYPESLVDKPLFSPSPMTLVMQDTDNLLKNIITDENNNFVMETTIREGIPQESKLITPKSLSAFDIKVLNAIVMNIDMRTFYKDHTVVVSYSTLCNQIIDYNPGTRVYKKLEESCKKLVQYNYTYIYNNVYESHFNLIDRIDIDSEKKQISCIIGGTISDALIQRKLVTITSSVYTKLCNSLSSIICYALKKEQITNQNTLVGEYPYAYFQRIVRFKSKKKTVNIKLLKESLQEFVDNQVIIKEFSVSSIGVFTIHFLELSRAEISDLGLSTDS